MGVERWAAVGLVVMEVARVPLPTMVEEPPVAVPIEELQEMAPGMVEEFQQLEAVN